MHKDKAFQSKACQRKTDSGQNLPVQTMNWGKSCHYSFFPMEKALTGQQLYLRSLDKSICRGKAILQEIHKVIFMVNKCF